ncbi:hypothetical protein [Chryseobacterium taihuense]|uniref:DUF2157 domain-containing protein n=1 Tax=Chryseobacterium taihuense TaxID=1141221 RepID=A0ABY0QV61_9FLAO|nr:hypothetical protein [Chryseobacterium taihuense]SDL95849.1 hypothetical protein SAMN05216273_109112 [Chryseobacterium taihuense]
MDEFQIRQIRNYLLSKNLPIDLLIEVEDHFVMQIADIMKREDINFDNAFYQVKILWENELSFPKYKIQFNLNDVTHFVRKINRNILRETLKKTFFYSIITGTFVFGGILFFNENIFKNFSFIAFLAIFLAPLLGYILKWKDFQLAKKYDRYVLTYYQNFILIVAGGSGAFAQILFRYHEISPELYKTLTGAFTPEGIFAFFGCFMMIVWSVFNVICQLKYLGQINKVKPYLYYLKASS